MAKASQLITQEEHAAIEAAIQQAETGTSGEIIPVLVSRCSHYSYASYLFGFFTSLIIFIFCWFFFQSLYVDAGSWGNSHTLNVRLSLLLLIMMIAFVWGGALAAFFPRLKLLFVTHRDMQAEVKRRAEEAFFHYGARKTRAATGVVIFVALFEQMVRVQGDSAISEKLTQQDWDAVRDVILQGIQENKVAEGFIQGIKKSGELLRQHFPLEGEASNDLPNNFYIID
jgi:putative membrane protein